MIVAVVIVSSSIAGCGAIAVTSYMITILNLQGPEKEVLAASYHAAPHPMPCLALCIVSATTAPLPLLHAKHLGYNQVS